MPGILDLFENQGDPNGPPTPANLTAALHDALGAHGYETQPPDPGAGAPGQGVAPDPAAGAPLAPPAPSQAQEPPPAAPAPAPPVVGPPPVPDPFATMTAEERAELLMLRQGLMDPERQAHIRRAYLGVTETPPPPAPEPQLPADVDPESFEAQLWRSQQETQRQIAQLAQQTARAQEQTEAQRAQAAANAAGARFAQRYGAVLTQDEIAGIARTAGSRGLPQAMVSARVAQMGGRPPTQAEIEDAMVESLEFVLRSDNTLLARVLGTGQPAPPPGPPTVSPTLDNKRVLTALSTGASPAGEPTPRPPLEHRPDGRLTEASRSQMMEQIVAGMRGGEGQGA
jgi:hypothetical protein